MNGIQSNKINIACCLVGVALAFLATTTIAPRHHDDENNDVLLPPPTTWQRKDLIRALCGGFGSVIAITALYPLETARTRLQVDPTLSPRSSLPLILSIVGREGAAGLYKGWSSLVVAIFSTNFVYFYAYHWCRRFAVLPAAVNIIAEGDEGVAGAGVSIMVDLINGFIAGVATVLVTNPIWVINTRMKLQGVTIRDGGGRKQRDNVASDGEDDSTTKPPYRNSLDCLLQIWKDDGVLALWTGTFSSILLASNPAIQFVVYEALKQRQYVQNYTVFFVELLGADKWLASSKLEPFFNAAAAKLIATLLTYPMQIVQTRRRAGVKDNGSDGTKSRSNQTNKKEGGWGWPCLLSSTGTSWFTDLSTIVKKDGVPGLYRGLETKLLQTCLNAGLMFLIYEHLFSFLTFLLDA